jgi:hypothetical protein
MAKVKLLFLFNRQCLHLLVLSDQTHFVKNMSTASTKSCTLSEKNQQSCGSAPATSVIVFDLDGCVWKRMET